MSHVHEQVIWQMATDSSDTDGGGRSTVTTDSAAVSGPPLRNFVNGEHVDAKSGRTAAVTDPCTGEPCTEAPVSGPDDVDAALKAAAAAFTRWRRTTPAERSVALLKIADALEARAEAIISAEGRNTGKPFALTMAEEIPMAVDQIRFFAGAARLLEGRAAGEVHDRLHVVRPPRARWRSLATARTSRCTASRTTPASST